MKKRRVYQPENKNIFKTMMNGFRRMLFRPGSIIKTKTGRKYQVQENGEWRRYKDEK